MWNGCQENQESQAFNFQGHDIGRGNDLKFFPFFLLIFFIFTFILKNDVNFEANTNPNFLVIKLESKSLDPFY